MRRSASLNRASRSGIYGGAGQNSVGARRSGSGSGSGAGSGHANAAGVGPMDPEMTASAAWADRAAAILVQLASVLRERDAGDIAELTMAVISHVLSNNEAQEALVTRVPDADRAVLQGLQRDHGFATGANSGSNARGGVSSSSSSSSSALSSYRNARGSDRFGAAAMRFAGGKRRRYGMGADDPSSQVGTQPQDGAGGDAAALQGGLDAILSEFQGIRCPDPPFEDLGPGADRTANVWDPSRHATYGSFACAVAQALCRSFAVSNVLRLSAPIAAAIIGRHALVTRRRRACQCRGRV